jgi:hypothetical protein
MLTILGIFILAGAIFGIVMLAKSGNKFLKSGGTAPSRTDSSAKPPVNKQG